MIVRSTKQRTRDVLDLFAREQDAWVASASESGEAYLIPLSYAWTGLLFIMATPGNSLTARNLERAGRARIAIGPTRDVAIVMGAIERLDPTDDDPLWRIHKCGAGFDARSTNTPYCLLILTPDQIQAWRNPAELDGRDLMREGKWLVPDVVDDVPDQKPS